MSAEVVEYWLASRHNAIIGQISLRPIENTLRKGKPLSSQHGQAETFFLIDDNGDWWILKKFHGNCKLDPQYLTKVGELLPGDKGFACGTKRQVLSKKTLCKTRGYHFSTDLDRWLDGTILMPRIKGLDWAGLADEIREGGIQLNQDQRLAIGRNLTKLVTLMEARQCCHRDFSCGNIFINPQTLEVYLIDFDSFYHPSLSMPRATTCGTTGYTAHHAWSNGQLDARRTWCQHADRYALALLNIEFLLVRPGLKATGEGGIFDQDELKRQAGNGINSVIGQLRSEYPHAAKLLKDTIESPTFSDCPSPQDWKGLFNTGQGRSILPPSLDDLNIAPERCAKILSKCRPAAPLWPAPNLNQMPMKIPRLPRSPKTQNSDSVPWWSRWMGQG
jgi:serine/threonine protein kinase